MPYAKIQSGQPVELTGGTITSGDVQFSYETMLLWSDAERAAKKIYPIIDDAIPSRKMATGSALQYMGGSTVRRVWTLADAPAPVYTTNKSDFWRRATTEEANMLDGALNDAPAFLRQLFNAVTIIDHSAPEFSTLRDAVANTQIGTGIIGYTRADQLLAPS